MDKRQKLTQVITRLSADYADEVKGILISHGGGNLCEIPSEQFDSLLNDLLVLAQKAGISELFGEDEGSDSGGVDDSTPGQGLNNVKPIPIEPEPPSEVGSGPEFAENMTPDQSINISTADSDIDPPDIVDLVLTDYEKLEFVEEEDEPEPMLQADPDENKHSSAPPDYMLAVTRFRNRKQIVGDRYEVPADKVFQSLKKTKRTKETVAEYQAMSAKEKADIKDVGGFLFATSKDGTRKNQSIIARSALTLDCDQGTPEFLEGLKSFPNQMCVYSTHSHTPETPRFRMIIPLDRDVTPTEYEVIATVLIKELGTEYFDKCSVCATQLMYYPSTPADGEYVWFVTEGPRLCSDVYLGKADKETAEKLNKSTKKRQDPSQKPGVIGAFNKAYSVEEAIDTFLPDVYERVSKNRYHFKQADSSAGLVIFDGYAYSFHSGDPASGRAISAYDLVRIHKFGEEDQNVPAGTKFKDLPSQKEMRKFASQDSKVQACMPPKEDWKDQIKDKKGNCIVGLKELGIIIENDPNLAGFVYNCFEGTIENHGNLPWLREGRVFTDRDLSSLKMYMAKNYQTVSDKMLIDAIVDYTNSSEEHRYHPVKEYFERVTWDKKERLDTLMIDYLGAADDEYTRAVTRKTFVAAVARIYKPGTKFDHMLILEGQQGIGKSTIFSKMAGQWFGDSLTMLDMRDKTGSEKLRGKLILEVSEMNGRSKADVETIKAFISSFKDSYRPSYERTVRDFLRQCIIVGTTNNSHGYLRDTTGNRRFWPVSVYGAKRHPWDLTDEEIAQIWAEAKYRYEQGEKLYLEGELAATARERQMEAMEEDGREEVVWNYLERLLPENWDQMNLFQRREFLQSNKTGTVLRRYVCAKEIACELFGFDEKTPKRDYQFIYGIMDRFQDTWRWRRSASGKRTHNAIPLFGGKKCAQYERIMPSDAGTTATSDDKKLKDQEN